VEDLRKVGIQRWWMVARDRQSWWRVYRKSRLVVLHNITGGGGGSSSGGDGETTDRLLRVSYEILFPACALIVLCTS
jgi:hypothetical protein